MLDSIPEPHAPRPRRVVGIVQARMGSSRFPGKVLADLAGAPMLVQIIQRVRPSRWLDALVVATTEERPDDALVVATQQVGLPWFRGSAEDCLDRYYRAAVHFQAELIVRLTADNPMVEAGFVDWVVDQFLAASPPYDYMSSWASQTFPVGLSVEVITVSALAMAWKEETTRQGREHVTPFLYQHPDRFRIGQVTSPQDYSHLRWTVDTPDDLAFVRRLYDHMGRAQFSWREAVAVLEQNPALLEINTQIRQASEACR